MRHITGIPRNQMTVPSLESSISVDNPIRFIDAFGEHIGLKTILILLQKKEDNQILVIIFKTFNDNSISVDGM